MTREEVIKMLEYVKHVGNGESEYKNDAQAIAIDMAIKVLQQNPCVDCISRKGVISQVEYVLSHPDSELRKGLEDTLRKAKTCISVQPMRPKGEWLKDEYGIYCSNCQNGVGIGYKFCPCCGADMRGE